MMIRVLVAASATHTSPQWTHKIHRISSEFESDKFGRFMRLVELINYLRSSVHCGDFMPETAD